MSGVACRPAQGAHGRNSGRRDWQPQYLSSLLTAAVKVWCRTETGEAPGRQGATTENTGLYLKEEHRSRPGCIACRMQPTFTTGF